MQELLQEAHQLLAGVVRLRRSIHREPELGLDLPLTQAKVLDELRELPLELRTGQRTTSVIADLCGALPGPAILLRADMDALPLHEDTGLDFASRNAGRMHACGHDAHTAMLVGAARILARRQTELHGTVRFMFQPGEEGYGGAAVMLEEGLLDIEPAAAFALQATPRWAAGTSPPGQVRCWHRPTRSPSWSMVAVGMPPHRTWRPIRCRWRARLSWRCRRSSRVRSTFLRLAW